MKLLMIGSGGHASVVLSALESRGVWDDLVGFLDDYEQPGVQKYGKPILGPISHLESIASDYGAKHFFIAIGDNQVRRLLAESAPFKALQAITIIHSTAIVDTLQECIAPGVFIGPGAIVNHNTIIHRYAIVNSGAIVEHDAFLGAFSHLAPGAVMGGGACVGSDSFVGLNATIRDHVQVSAGATVGMGSVVISDVPHKAVVAGNPARPIKCKHENNPAN